MKKVKEIREIREEDIVFSRAVYFVIKSCISSFGCFLSEEERMSLGCDCAFLNKNWLNEFCEGSCPIVFIKKSFQLNSPHFLDVLRKKFYEVPISEREIFLILLLVFNSTLFSLNNPKVPVMSKQFIDKLASRLKRRSNKFSHWIITKKINKPNQNLLNEGYYLVLITKDGIDKKIWGKISMLLDIFFEGMQPVQPLINRKDRKALQKEIERFFKERGRRR